MTTQEKTTCALIGLAVQIGAVAGTMVENVGRKVAGKSAVSGYVTDENGNHIPDHAILAVLCQKYTELYDGLDGPEA